jgi:hypothetical protein
MVEEKRPAGNWLHRLRRQFYDSQKTLLTRLRNATPFEHLRFGLTSLLFLVGVWLLAILIMPQYDRALVLSGRTEVLSARLDDAAFGNLEFDRAIYRADPDTSAQQGRLQIEVVPGATVRFVRTGRGAVRLTFASPEVTPVELACGTGLHRIGSATLEGTTGALCDAATIVVPLASDGDPLVVGLSSGIVVGEEVSQGAGQRPILLEATASLLVKHGNAFFRSICSWEELETLCERFVANSVALSPGDSVRADEHTHIAKSLGSLGFVRIDPNDLQGGMLFNLAAPAAAFEVQRMQGEAFTVRESLFEIIEKSPVVRALNSILVALGVVSYFLRLTARGSKEGGCAAAALLFGALLYGQEPAQAQQVLLRADETGQGLLRSRGDRCYAVTPSHVLGAETSALLTAPGRAQGEADLLRRIPAAPEAVALMTARGVPLTMCPPFEGTVSLDDILRAHAGATLQLVRADGSIDRIPLMLGTVEVETLEVRDDAGSLEQGMSGGTVLVSDQPVGLLVDVTDGGHVGRVARLDRIFERLVPHLGSSPTEVTHAPSGSVPYDVVRSNAVPLEPGNRVSGLQGDGREPWRVTADGRIELIVKLTVPFSGVVLDLSGLPDPPQTVEILAGHSEQGPWQSLATLSLEPGDALQQRHFTSVALRFVLLRAYAPTTRKTLAIARLAFVPN